MKKFKTNLSFHETTSKNILNKGSGDHSKQLTTIRGKFQPNNILNSPITDEEIRSCVKLLKNNKAPRIRLRMR